MWQVLIKHNPEEKLEHVSVSAKHLVAFKRVNGLQQATVYDLSGDGSAPTALSEPRKIEFAEPAYTLESGAQVCRLPIPPACVPSVRCSSPTSSLHFLFHVFM
jgi:protease II